MKQLLAILLAFTMTIAMTACAAKDGAASSSAPTESAPAQPDTASAPAEPSAPAMDTSAITKIDSAATAAAITAAIEGTGEYAGNPIATMETSEGVIKIRLFPKEAPKAVENFITHAKAGYYDGLTFHRIINDFMIQGGDPTGTGAGGESIWGAAFEDEFSDVLHNFRGALSMANAGANTNGSQFFVVQSKTAFAEADYADQFLMSAYMSRALSAAQSQMTAAELAGKSQEELQTLAGELNGMLMTVQQSFAEGDLPAEFTEAMKPMMDKYNAEGGTPFLDYKHTVFGYVTEGMDVVDKIAALDSGETDEQGNSLGKPSKSVTIVKITVEE